MRNTLKVFSVFDLISIFFLGMQLYYWMKRWEEIPYELLTIIKVTGSILMFLALFITMVGQFYGKRYAFITYYIQFPFRLLLWVFSLGFITLLPENFGRFEDFWFEWLFRLCVLGEFLRLYFTILFHRRSAQRLRLPLQ